MNPPATDKVSCNGSCRKRFRPAAVNLNQATANVLLSSTRAPGLFWLCPDCHQTTQLQCTARNHSEVLSRSDLPPELWLMIFRHLDKRAMLRVRSTCRRWKAIVDQNKSLRNGFIVGFEGLTMDEEFYPENLFPAAETFLSRTKIGSVDGWWPSFGAGLTYLLLAESEISFARFLGMLRETPNLTRLSLSCVNFSFDGEIEADFRLEKLEYLSCDEVIDIFSKIFPRLRKLELSCELLDEESACRLMQSAQRTLKELDCLLTSFMLEQMANMNRLRLANAEIPLAEVELVVQLSQIQPMIEKLNTAASNEALCKIGRNLDKLKELTVALEEVGTVVLTFPSEMPQLTLLHLEGPEEICLNLKHFKCANLINLTLQSFRFTAGSLQRCLTNCPNLQKLVVEDCSLNSWSDILKARLESLRSLYVWKVKVARNVMDVPKKLSFVNQLKFSLCNISLEMLVKLLLQCPRLEKLMLNRITTIDDKFVRILDQFPQLKELSIHYCAITYRSLELIAEKYSHLKVDIRSEQIPNAALLLMKYVTRS